MLQTQIADFMGHHLPGMTAMLDVLDDDMDLNDIMVRRSWCTCVPGHNLTQLCLVCLNCSIDCSPVDNSLTIRLVTEHSSLVGYQECTASNVLLLPAGSYTSPLFL